MLITINPEAKHQTIEGWGTSLAWFGNVIGGWNMPGRNCKKTAREEIAEMLFDEHNGINFNIVRYNIGGGDDLSHTHITRLDSNIPGYKISKDAEYNWDADVNQVWMLKQAIKHREKYGNDIILEAFSNSPPYWMTESGCFSGNADPGKDNLKPEYYEAFAQYLVDICNYFKEELGIVFDYLEPVNEPDTDFWHAFSHKQEGCHFDPASVDKILKVLYKELVRQGLAGEIKLTTSDETNIDTAIEVFEQLSEEAKSYVVKINTHAYSGTKREELRALAGKYNKKLWMSEFGAPNETNDYTFMGSALRAGSVILKDLRELRATAWLTWQGIEHCADDTDNPQDIPWSLMHGLYEKVNPKSDLSIGDYFPTKQYYAVGQFSKFIKKEYIIIDSDYEQSVAAISPNGDEIILVVQNDTKQVQTHKYCFKGIGNYHWNVQGYRTSSFDSLSRFEMIDIDAEGYIFDELPCQSITTYVLTR